MDFEEHLDNLVVQVQAEQMREFADSAGELAELLDESLREILWEEPWPTERARRLERVARRARRSASLVDAADFIGKIMEGANFRIEEVPWSDDLERNQARIERTFDEQAVPDRGFVYVAWRGKPAGYEYVGKAGSRERLNLAGHGKLASTQGRATRLSLLFPSQSRDETLRKFESSIIRVIEGATGEMPRFNERVSHRLEDDQFQRLSDLLGHVLAVMKADAR